MSQPNPSQLQNDILQLKAELKERDLTVMERDRLIKVQFKKIRELRELYSNTWQNLLSITTTAKSMSETIKHLTLRKKLTPEMKRLIKGTMTAINLN